VNWITEGDHKRCLRHSLTFAKKDVCPGCITDPPPALDQAEPELVDQAAVDDEQWLRARRDELLAFATQMTKTIDGTKTRARIQFSTLAKVYDTALKYHRAAADERRARAEHSHDRWLVKQCRELARRGVAN
jgi:hypothetical protein